MAEEGIPAWLPTACLATRKIVVEKSDSYTALVLCCMGISMGRWGTLLDVLRIGSFCYVDAEGGCVGETGERL